MERGYVYALTAALLNKDFKLFFSLVAFQHRRGDDEEEQVLV